MAIKVVDLTSESAPTEDDFLLVRENDTGTTRKMTISDFLSAFSHRFTPTGCIVPFGTTTPPSGFLVCDGSAIDRTTYADLFTVIGENFGPGNGSTTFNLPDFRGKIVIGKADTGNFNTINNSGGSETHNLRHSHTVSSHNHNNGSPQTGTQSTNHTHSGVQSGVVSSDGVSKNHTHTYVRSNANASPGTSQSLSASENVMPPYRVATYIIKT